MAGLWNFRAPAECNSAIQQSATSATLRYKLAVAITFPLLHHAVGFLGAEISFR
jgi:hypothetical protein